uniref:NADH-ubiquinone oxidoreductase chain 2 n=1 Tax=Neoephemera projecta TaxID=2770074 RepID=A0A8K1VCI6_9INSE|nr:NADH dehydrogenase subunit 2 [Neoephemera projecta]
MLINPSYILFLTTLISSTLISISSSSWMGVWMGLEINLLSFIPLMTQFNKFTAEAALKYFLIQALASSLLLMFIILMLMQIIEMNHTPIIYTELALSISLFIKMGAAPFHFWFPNVMEGLNWMSSAILMTWQKIAPIMIISYLYNMTYVFIMIISLSVIIGAISGLNQTSLRKIMAFSSISHLGWMLSAVMINNSALMMYFSFYSFLSILLIFMFNQFKLNHINQIFNSHNYNNTMKLIFFTNLLSLGGLPPFLGFAPKWMLIQLLTTSHFYMLILIMIMFNLVTLYFYLRLTYSALIITNNEFKWMNYNYYNIKPLTYLTLLSIMGLMFTPMLLI